MLGVVIGVLALAAVGAWAVAVLSALSIVGLAPKGRKLSAYFALGRWRFGEVEAIAGPAAAPHIARYKKAFMAFFACILATAVVIVLIAMAAQN